MRHGASCSSRRTDAPPRVRAGLWTRRDLCNVGVLIRESLPGGGAWREWAGLPPEQQPRAPDADAPRRIVFLTRADAPATGLPTPTCAAFRRSGSNCRVKSGDRGAHSAASPFCSRNQDRVAICSSLRTSRRWRRVGWEPCHPRPGTDPGQDSRFKCHCCKRPCDTANLRGLSAGHRCVARNRMRRGASASGARCIYDSTRNTGLADAQMRLASAPIRPDR